MSSLLIVMSLKVGYLFVISENTASQVLVPPSDSVMFISLFQHVEDPLKQNFFGNRSLNILFSGEIFTPNNH